MAGDRLADGLLAAGALATVLLAARLLDVPAAPRALLAGVAGALVVEFLLQRRAAVVRAHWARPAVRAGAVVGVLAAAGVAAALAPARGLSLLAGELVAYLGLLAGAAVGTAASSPDPE